MQVLRSWLLEFWIFWWDYDSILSLFFDIRCLQKFTAKCFGLVWVRTFTSKNITSDFCSLHLEWLKELSWFADFVVQIAFASAYARDVKRTVICYLWVQDTSRTCANEMWKCKSCTWLCMGPLKAILGYQLVRLQGCAEKIFEVDSPELLINLLKTRMNDLKADVKIGNLPLSR